MITAKVKKCLVGNIKCILLSGFKTSDGIVYCNLLTVNYLIVQSLKIVGNESSLKCAFHDSGALPHCFITLKFPNIEFVTSYDLDMPRKRHEIKCALMREKEKMRS
jgi:hypothetical protein